MPRFPTILKNAIQGAVDQLWPPLCAACDAPLMGGDGLCLDCWEKVAFLGPPMCDACGLPFSTDPGPGSLCANCAGARPPYDRARAALTYDDGSKPMILAFKHVDRTDLAPLLARWMMRPAAPLLSEANIVAPVPLHWTRLLSRRYNQAALLANRLALLGGVRAVPDLIERTKRTPSQGGRSRAGRKRNVQGAFRVPSRHRCRLRDMRVLLVDDVMTTGATLEAASRALLRAGAKAVDVVTLARVVKTPSGDVEREGLGPIF